MANKKVIILATEGLTTNLLYNDLLDYFDVELVILENKISKKILLKNRLKRLGFFKVIGQVLFMLLVVPVLSLGSKKRIKQILFENNKSSESIPLDKIKNIDSVNNKDVIAIVKACKPDFIFVNGTRIISNDIILNLNTKLINIHVGITPKYRGVHGGYWAVLNKDLELFGTTLHYIDSGIDTGEIIGQKTIEITSKDNFVTYPLIQYVLGLELIKGNIKNINDGVTVASIIEDSQLHYHPTITQYLFKRLFSKVK